MQKKPNLKAILIFWILALGWGGMLFFFSGQNANESGRLSAWFTGIVFRIFPEIPLEFEVLHLYIRKAAHFSIFALEGFLLGAAMMLSFRWKRLAGFMAAAGCAGMAVLNELHQTMAIGRSCEVRDMIIDASGSAAGVILAAIALWIVCRASGRKKTAII